MSKVIDDLRKELLYFYEADEDEQDNNTSSNNNQVQAKVTYFPAVTETDPGLPVYEPQEPNEDGSPKGEPDENEKKLYDELCVLNNNYISSIMGSIDDGVTNGWTQKKLNDTTGMLNEYKNALYKWGNEHKTDKISDEFKPILYGEFQRGCIFCKEQLDIIAEIHIDPDLNKNVDPKRIPKKEEVLQKIERGESQFEPNSLDDKTEAKANKLFAKMQKKAEDEKFKLSKALLGLQLTQDIIKAAAYTNPLTAAAYELYQNVYKPLKGIAKEMSQQDIKKYNEIKDKIKAYLDKWNISPKQLDDYVNLRSANKKPINSKQTKIGDTNTFLFEKWQEQEKITLEDLKLYLAMISRTDTGEINKAEQDKKEKDLDSIVNDLEIKTSQLKKYVIAMKNNGKDFLSGKDTEKIGNSTIGEFQKQLQDKQINFEILNNYTVNREKKQGKSELQNKFRELDSFRTSHQILLVDLQKAAEEMFDANIIDESIGLEDKIGDTKIKYLVKFLKNEDIGYNILSQYLDYAEQHKYSDNEQKELTKRNKKQKGLKYLKEIKDKFKIDKKELKKLVTELNLKDTKEIDTKQKIGDTNYGEVIKQLEDKGINDPTLLLELLRGDDMDETLQQGQQFPLTYLTGKKKSDFKDNKDIINYIEDKTDYTVIKDNGDTLEVADVTKPQRPHDTIHLNECLLLDVSEIGDGIVVFMPSGFQADLTLDDDTVDVDYYTHNDTYSVDEFGNLIEDGIIVFNQPTMIMEATDRENLGVQNSVLCTHSLKDHIETLNKLDNIRKEVPTGYKEKQSAITYMDASGLGVNLEKETDKLEKRAKKIDEVVSVPVEYYDFDIIRYTDRTFEISHEGQDYIIQPESSRLPDVKSAIEDFLINEFDKTVNAPSVRIEDINFDEDTGYGSFTARVDLDESLNETTEKKGCYIITMDGEPIGPNCKTREEATAWAENNYPIDDERIAIEYDPEPDYDEDEDLPESLNEDLQEDIETALLEFAKSKGTIIANLDNFDLQEIAEYVSNFLDRSVAPPQIKIVINSMNESLHEDYESYEVFYNKENNKYFIAKDTGIDYNEWRNGDTDEVIYYNTEEEAQKDCDELNKEFKQVNEDLDTTQTYNFKIEKINDNELKLTSGESEYTVYITPEDDLQDIEYAIEDFVEMELSAEEDDSENITGTEVVGFKYDMETGKGEFEANIFFEDNIDESLHEISDETKKKVQDKRFTDFVNSEDGEEDKTCKKLRKNIKLNKGKKEQMSEISKTIKELQKVMEDVSLDEQDMNEISDEAAEFSHIGRFKKLDRANGIRKEKLAHYNNIRDRFANKLPDEITDDEFDEFEDAAEELENAEMEQDKEEKKFDRNTRLLVNREARKYESLKSRKKINEILYGMPKSTIDEIIKIVNDAIVKGKIRDSITTPDNYVQLISDTIGLELADDEWLYLVQRYSDRFLMPRQPKDESLKSRKRIKEDVGGLTDIQDLDLPQALADTIEVTDDGNVMTLQTLYTEVQSLKNELTSAIQSIKDSVTAQMENLKNEVTNAKEVEVLQNIDNKVDELNTEIANGELEEQPTEEPETDEEENTEEIEGEEQEEDKEAVGESFINRKKVKITPLIEKFMVKGACSGLKQKKFNEDLNALKGEIDKATKEGKTADEIKNVIDLNAENDDEKKQAKDYATQKLSESDLLRKLKQTKDNSAITRAKFAK